jgi:hypothetical protein
MSRALKSGKKAKKVYFIYFLQIYLCRGDILIKNSGGFTLNTLSAYSANGVSVRGKHLKKIY